MNKFFVCSLMLLIYAMTGLANVGADTLKYYLDGAGQFMNTNEGAAFVRYVIKVSPTDKYYTVQDYFVATGKLRSVGQSKSEDGFGKFGNYLEYHPNGKRAMFKVYNKDGFPINYITYHDNGQINIVAHRDQRTYKEFIDECRDSTGTVTVNNGNGMQLITQGPESEEFGPIVDGVRNGDWQLRVKGKIAALLTYRDNRFISGIGYDSIGKAYPFETVMEMPAHKDGMNLYYTIRRQIVMPKKVKEQVMNRQAFVNFWIETDGTISDITLSASIGMGIDEQLIAAIKKTSGQWTVGKQYGIPIRSQGSFHIRITPDF